MAGRRRQRSLAGFPAAAPEAAGLDPEPLRRLQAAVDHNVSGLNALPGCAHVVLKDGKCVFARATGLSDVGRRTKFSLDTLCPLHGATKPLVAAAFLTLVDEGRVKLSDPVEKYIRFPDRVALGTSAASRCAATKPTLRHLLAMTAGVGYDDFRGYKKAMAQVARQDIHDLPGMCDALVEAPLQFEPGRRYHYSFSTDLIGRVCEMLSGQRIDKFVRERLLRPLGMKDTHFDQALPARKRRRVATLYTVEDPPRRKRRSALGRLKKRKRTARGGKAAPSTRFVLKRAVFKASAPGIMSCGGGVLSYRDFGMLSSVRDYARFCQMLLDGGLAPGSRRRILGEGLVSSLWKDGLAAYQRPDGRVLGWHDSPSPMGQPKGYWNHISWSLLNTHLVFKKAPGEQIAPRAGRVMWMGGGGGAFWSVDRERGVVALSFAPIIGGRATEDDGLGPLANDASSFAALAVDSAGRGRGAKRKRSSVGS